MKLEQQVVSLELAKKLKSLGVKQESAFYWVYSKMSSFWQVLYGPYHGGADTIAAFTVAELGEMLPNNKVHTLKWFGQFYCEAWDDVVEKTNPITRCVSDTEADARAKMLVYLIEQGIVKV